MKQFSGIELVRVVKELKEQLIDGKINQIYVDFDRAGGTKKELLFEIYVHNKGRQLLRIILPNLIFLCSTKPTMPTTPDGYCLYLRKWLKNARIKNIEQLGLERILCVTLEKRDVTRDGTREVTKEFTKNEPVTIRYFIYIELFSRGNFILANEQNIILSPLDVQEWSGRKIKPKEPYIYPKQEYCIFSMNNKEFAECIEQSSKDSVVTILAIDFGLGGLYAEELCSRAGVAKETKKMKITTKEAELLFSAFLGLKKEIEQGNVFVVKEDAQLIDIVPCHIQRYGKAPYIIEESPSFLKAIDSYFGASQKTEKYTIEKTAKEKDIEKLKIRVQSQEKQILQYEEESLENQGLGNKIYENYKKIEEIFYLLAEERKNISWSEIKRNLKKYPAIKQINEKEQEIIIEL